VSGLRLAIHVARVHETPPAASPLFTPTEREYCLARGEPEKSLAARYAAKRAAATLLGLDEEKLSEIEVAREPGRPPSLTFSGEARRSAERLGLVDAQVSLSHSGNYAVALVVIE
jgi:phosphopantetheine--protein transferase-like protein